MLCPSCRKSDTRVLDSRDEKFFVRRRRLCKKCKFRFTTFERLDQPKIRVLKKSGNFEDYDREKILHGLRLALEKRPVSSHKIDEMVANIEQKILETGKKAITSKMIGDLLIIELKQVDDVAYLRFISVFKKFGSAKKFQKEAEKLG